MNWITTEPPIGKHDGSVWKRAYSDDVIGLDSEGYPHRVFYDHQYKNWNCVDSQCRIEKKIVAWIALPNEA